MRCRVCQGDTRSVIDLGRQALAGAFVKPEDAAAEQHHPLRLVLCLDCATLQVDTAIPAGTLFDNYFYRTSTSASLRRHFEQYAEDIVARFAPQRVVEIGCNDGAMLKHLARLAPVTIGVEPSGAGDDLQDSGATVLRGYFDAAMASRIGKADVVVANNVFAHVEDIHGVTAAVRSMLNEDGVFVFEVHYLGDMVKAGQYDAIYHEHVFYWSLLSVEKLLAQHGLQVFDVQPQRTHGGSMRFFACPTGERRALPQVMRLRDAELLQLLDWHATFERLADEAAEHRRQLVGLLRRLRAAGHEIAAYGASGRANTMLQWCGIGPELVSYVVDDCPGKQGHLTPGTHIPILPPTALADNPPDWLLLTAWTFADEIKGRIPGYGGGFIKPFPRVEIVAPEARVAA